MSGGIIRIFSDIARVIGCLNDPIVRVVFEPDYSRRGRNQLLQVPFVTSFELNVMTSSISHVEGGSLCIILGMVSLRKQKLASIAEIQSPPITIPADLCPVKF